ncbi:MAG: MG2 domain-containing protein, partial [Bdellovibrionales bacterium]|nr:MG2 domain-containing protein [Bdellovibrionales bacterium]
MMSRLVTARLVMMPIAAVTFMLMVLFGWAKAGAAEVVSVSPLGAVKRVQQIVVRFSDDIVPMGDPRSHRSPFQIECRGGVGSKVETPSYSVRWIDSRNWSLDFAKPLGSGMACALIFSGIKDLKGRNVKSLAQYSFTTGGPAILQVAPDYGEIEPGQHFVLYLEGAVQQGAIEKHAYFESSKLPGKNAVRVLSGAERERIVRAAIASNWQWQSFRALLKKPFKDVRAFDQFVVIAARNRFIESSKVVLHWPKGILSSTGIPVAEAQKFEFGVIAPFEVTFSCERVNADRGCNPLSGMSLNFSRSVDRALLRGTKLVAGEHVWEPVELSATEGREKNLQTLTFKNDGGVAFPDQTSFQVVLPKGTIRDELGRSLVNAGRFPLTIRTDESVPLVKFAAPFGLLERNADPVLPVSLRNVEANVAGQSRYFEGKSIRVSSKSSVGELIQTYLDVREKDRSYERRSESLLNAKDSASFQLPSSPSKEASKAKASFELVGIPLKGPGLHVVELASPKLGNALLGKDTMYVATGALVTNMGVHLKKGRESSLVWVTTLDKAEPVKDAEVSIVRRDGSVLASGKTDASGLWRVKDVDYPCQWDDENRWGEDCEVFAVAKSGDDVSFVSSTWDRGLETYRFNVSSEYLSKDWGPIVAHAVFDRTVAQAGETISFKTYLREYQEQGFRIFPANRIPKRILIRHRASGKVYSFPFEYDAKTGTAATAFLIPKDATLGLYDVSLSAKPQAAKSEEGQGDASFYDWSAQTVGDF